MAEQKGYNSILALLHLHLIMCANITFDGLKDWFSKAITFHCNVTDKFNHYDGLLKKSSLGPPGNALILLEHYNATFSFRSHYSNPAKRLLERYGKRVQTQDGESFQLQKLTNEIYNILSTYATFNRAQQLEKKRLDELPPKQLLLTNNGNSTFYAIYKVIQYYTFFEREQVINNLPSDGDVYLDDFEYPY